MDRCTFKGMIGFSAGRRVFLGFGSADVLKKLSFADVLDEDTGNGYQRRFNSQHSLDFRRYIQKDRSTTIPLTFNLRPRSDGAWKIIELKSPFAYIEVAADAGKVLSQVDCQHRLGHLDDLAIDLPFMCFLGLSDREEMEIFSVINSKAKGLSTSLLDYHEAQLASDLASDRPELFIALHLNNELTSPWYRQLDLGGNSTSGLSRRASLRTMQKAVKRFLGRTKLHHTRSGIFAAQVVLDFWSAVSTVLPRQWSNPRKHLLTKGVGVYSLMELAADLCLDANIETRVPDRRFFVNALSDFLGEIDWSSSGPLKGFGGEGGVRSVVELVREARKKVKFQVVSNG